MSDAWSPPKKINFADKAFHSCLAKSSGQAHFDRRARPEDIFPRLNPKFIERVERGNVMSSIIRDNARLHQLHRRRRCRERIMLPQLAGGYFYV